MELGVKDIATASTGNADRQRVIRHLVDHVVVEVQGKSEFVDCTIHWKGGYQSHHEVTRSVCSYTQLRDFDRLKDRVIELNKQDFCRLKWHEQKNKYIDPKAKGVKRLIPDNIKQCKISG